jgi:hypothetical protein
VCRNHQQEQQVPRDQAGPEQRQRSNTHYDVVGRDLGTVMERGSS